MAAIDDALSVLKERIGVEQPPGDWFEVTQDQVNKFADATGDHQWIHVDVERAKKRPFRRANRPWSAHAFDTRVCRQTSGRERRYRSARRGAETGHQLRIQSSQIPIPRTSGVADTLEECAEVG